MDHCTASVCTVRCENTLYVKCSNVCILLMCTFSHSLSRAHGDLLLQVVVKRDILEPQHIVNIVCSP